jgi:uncharacterized protein (DUF58 family)
MASRPPVIDARARAALRRLEWRLRGRRVETTLAGDHRSIFRGRGIEFDQVVRFEFGDDVREIDWNVTARLGDVYRKVFVEDREINVVVVIADTPQLQFGSGDRSKREVLLEAAALVMLFSASNRERVMVIRQSMAGSQVFAPTRERARILTVINALFALPPPDPLAGMTALSPILQERIPRGALVIHLGDVPDAAPPPEWGGWLRRHRVIGIRADDAWDREGPAIAAMAVYDPVAGGVVELADTPETRANHAAWRTAREARWRAWWANPADRLVIGPAEDVLDALTGFLRAREGRGTAQGR